MHQQHTIATVRSAASGSQRAESWQAALEAGGRAVLGLGRGGRVLTVSPAAEALLGGALQVRGGYLALADPVLQARLSCLVGAAVRHDARRAERLPSPVIIREHGGRSLHADALPLARDRQAPLRGMILALLLLHELDEVRGSGGDVLRQRFGLTPAEARLALALADGTGLAAAAHANGIRVSTARAHLKAIFGKTDTHRQAELVALLARLP